MTEKSHFSAFHFTNYMYELNFYNHIRQFKKKLQVSQWATYEGTNLQDVKFVFLYLFLLNEALRRRQIINDILQRTWVF